MNMHLPQVPIIIVNASSESIQGEGRQRGREGGREGRTEGGRDGVDSVP